MAGRRGRALLAVLVVAGLLAASAIGFAEEWGGIEPGVTTLEQVRARYGAPSREMRAKVDNYDTVQWIYEGNRSPAGFQRMTADYGLLTPQGYKPTVVRVLRLEPKAKVFGRNTVLQGWGAPDGIARQNDQDSLFYKSGLVVTFNKEGTDAVLLTFTPPQPDSPAPAAPRR
ncbi:MAG TPA: hypothetical protein VK878_20570 [Candidatus Deferrimicrobiaceae bacterium]|nr:hypothetical protein [Candidatus Deferrimicrobiaceae bacterium]